MKRLIVLAAVLCVAPALAQQPASPEAQALAQKLMAEINSSIACSAGAITLQQQLATAQARIKALEDKYEPKPPEKK